MVVEVVVENGLGEKQMEGKKEGFHADERQVRCSTKREGERNGEGGKGRRMNKKINI